MTWIVTTAATAVTLIAGAFAFSPRAELVTSVDIDATPAEVWSVLADGARYGEWNPFIVKMEGAATQGARLSNTMRPSRGSEMTFRPTVLKADAGRELRWLGRFVLPRVFDGEHYFLLQPHDGGTRLVHGEAFRGVALWFMDVEPFRTDFEAMNAALKVRVEEAR